ncbi:MAG TPA: hypothetical protein EYP89_00630, partial [Candidatus Omnitrophica bacterium]|nr:hypothetical protein [Candidatus Omnitrophota bacterium]
KIRINKEKVRKSLEDDSLYAPLLVEILVNKGVPFKEAHTMVGKLIRYIFEKKIKLRELPASILNKLIPPLSKTEVKRIIRRPS